MYKIIYLGNAFETNDLICSLLLFALILGFNKKASICSYVGTAGVGSTNIESLVTVRCNCCVGGGDSCFPLQYFLGVYVQPWTVNSLPQSGQIAVSFNSGRFRRFGLTSYLTSPLASYLASSLTSVLILLEDLWLLNQFLTVSSFKSQIIAIFFTSLLRGWGF